LVLIMALGVVALAAPVSSRQNLIYAIAMGLLV
jgi:hypothetical protein